MTKRIAHNRLPFKKVKEFIEKEGYLLLTEEDDYQGTRVKSLLH